MLWLQEHLQSTAAAGAHDAALTRCLIAFLKGLKDPGEPTAVRMSAGAS